MRLTGFISAVILLVGLTGCSDKNKDQPQTPGTTVEVTGTVTYQGKPVPMGTVRFMAEEGREEAMVRFENGKYKLAAPAGKVRVCVDTSMVKDMYDNPAERAKFYMPIPMKYARFTDTPLKMSTTGASMDLNIEITE